MIYSMIALPVLAVYILAAVIPAVILLRYVYRHDTVEKEPPGLLLSLLLMGVVAALASGILERIAQGVLGVLVRPGSLLHTVLLAFLVVAVVEEGMKFLLLKWRSWHHPAFNYRFDGIVYAVFAVSLNALCNPGDEVVVIAPFFPEYRVFAEQAGAVLRVVPADLRGFQIDFSALEEILNPKTKAIIVNSPNNPTGALLSAETLKKLCELLKSRSEAYGSPIFLLSDEPYRELVYDATAEVPYLTNLYDHTLVCYSFSKSLSLPGERIGYIAVCNRMAEFGEVYAAVCGAGRALGFVCAPSMMQKLLPSVLGKTADVEVYRTNRDLLYGALSAYGFSCVYPDGAFYLFVKSPVADASAFCEKAKEFELLLVPSDSFGCPGYVRISYCVSTEQIKRSLPAFEKLAKAYGLC